MLRDYGRSCKMLDEGLKLLKMNQKTVSKLK